MGNDKKLLQSINRSLDGVNSRRQEAWLKRQMEQDPAARKLYGELEKITKSLRKPRMADPPGNLRQRILTAVRPAEGMSRSQKERNPLVRFSPAFRVRPVFAFAGGVLLGCLLFFVLFESLFRGFAGNPADLYGTMMAKESTERMAVLDQAEIRQGGVIGTIESRRNGDKVLVILSLSTRDKADVIVSYNPEGFEVLGCQWTGESEQPLTLSRGSVQLTLSDNQNLKALLLDHRGNNQPIWISISRLGKIVYERTLASNRSGELR